MICITFNNFLLALMIQLDWSVLSIAPLLAAVIVIEAICAVLINNSLLAEPVNKYKKVKT